MYDELELSYQNADIDKGDKCSMRIRKRGLTIRVIGVYLDDRDSCNESVDNFENVCALLIRICACFACIALSVGTIPHVCAQNRQYGRFDLQSGRPQHRALCTFGCV